MSSAADVIVTLWDMGEIHHVILTQHVYWYIVMRFYPLQKRTHDKLVIIVNV